MRTWTEVGEDGILSAAHDHEFCEVIAALVDLLGRIEQVLDANRMVVMGQVIQIDPNSRPASTAGFVAGDFVEVHGLVVSDGTVAALVRRMVITEREEELLPRWARFVIGLVDCPVLAPTASRESLRRDRAFERVGLEIERQLLAFLGSRPEFEIKVEVEALVGRIREGRPRPANDDE